MPPTLFVPANTRAAGLLIANVPDGGSVAYAATTHGCGSQPDGVWAMELGADKKDVVAFQPKDAMIAGSAGPTLGHDGTVYITTAAGSSPMSNQLIALESKTLKAEGRPRAWRPRTSTRRRSCSRTRTRTSSRSREPASCICSTPAALTNGPVATATIAGTDKFESGALASWEDAQNARWIAVPSSRGIVTFKVSDDNGKPALQPGWTSRDIASPLPPLVVNGVLFTASSGNARGAVGALRDRCVERQGAVEQSARRLRPRCAADSQPGRATCMSLARTARCTRLALP